MAASDVSLTASQQAAFDLLMTRQSRLPLAAPVPPDAVLARVLDAAMRAPDHGRLRPLRAVLVREARMPALGELLAAAALRRDPQADVERVRRKARNAPMAIAFGAHLTEAEKVPEVEQLLSVGASAMNMLNALHILGYGGFWATGPAAHDPAFAEALGFSGQERLLGLLYVGTPQGEPKRVERPAGADVLREWQG